MPKQCKHIGCTNNQFGGGYCKFHQYMRSDAQKKLEQQNARNKASALKYREKNRKKQYVIPKKSASMKKKEAKYFPKRNKYMEQHPFCEVKACKSIAHDLHHKAGRVGFADEWARNNDVPLIADERYFMAICRKHHTQCDTDPIWARTNGYLI